MPLEEDDLGDTYNPNRLLLTGKELLQQIEGDVSFSIICKPNVVVTKNDISDLPLEIQDMLSEYGDIIVDDFPSELPPIRKINHHMDLIPWTSLRNKVSYRRTP